MENFYYNSNESLTWGNASINAIIQIINIYLNALDKLDSVCDRNGWQIATYRSTVNAVIVSTVAFVDVSAANPLSMQNISPNT